MRSAAGGGVCFVAPFGVVLLLAFDAAPPFWPLEPPVLNDGT